MQRRRILKAKRTEEQRAMELGEERAGMTSTREREARGGQRDKQPETT